MKLDHLNGDNLSITDGDAPCRTTEVGV